MDKNVIEQDLENMLSAELAYLTGHGSEKTAVSISTTAKHAPAFHVLPRRSAEGVRMSNFMVNDAAILESLFDFFDGKIDVIFADIEQKQEIQLFALAKERVKQSALLTWKPNDATLESCDLLIRSRLGEDLAGLSILVIGTGNLAGKIALRLAERQAHVFVKARTEAKEQLLIAGLNCMLPGYASAPIRPFAELGQPVSAVVSFLSGPIEQAEILEPYITQDTFLIDGGIGNFPADFIEEMLAAGTPMTRLDTRIALPYQLLSVHPYVQAFFKEAYGKREFAGQLLVAGGYMGPAGAIIVDHIQHPTQVIGMADGKGGVKPDEQLAENERDAISAVRQAISDGV